MLFEIDKNYKIILKDGNVYTCVILKEENGFILIRDKNNQERGISLDKISDFRKIGEIYGNY